MLSNPAWAEAALRRDVLIKMTFAEAPFWWEERVESRLEPDGDCLIWTGQTDGGYGRVHLPKAVTGGESVKVQVHRVAYLHEFGFIDIGLTLDHHVCRDRACAQPYHLEEVALGENSARSAGRAQEGIRARLETGLCPRGHDEWVRQAGKPDSWSCRTCQREWGRKRDAAIRAAASGLGLQWVEFVDVFGASRKAAEEVLTSLAEGAKPIDLVVEAWERKRGAHK